jgi:serine protease AprX
MASIASSDVSPAIDPALARMRGTVNVIIQKITPDRAPEREVVRLGGRINEELPIIGGFAATIDAGRLDDLTEAVALRTISLDRPMHLMGAGDPASTLKSVYPKSVRATDAWKSNYTGRGVTVALIDTGVADVPDLAGRIVRVEQDPTDAITGTTHPCVNLSGESGCGDSYGHGTFIAGIIAGNGASSGGAWKGVAPEAKIVSIKIAGRDGAADVSNILAAIQWAVSFKDKYGIRVMNLSLGTDSTQSYRTDPLNYAVERAWHAGITVVVSASNRGPGAQTISKPGDDPFVITVGAVDDRETTGVGDDRLPNFSGRGPTAADGIAKPDVVAPGARLVSLRAVGSEIDTRFPNYIDGAYRRGSGTSMAAGVVSGAAAIIHQAQPTATPDRVKYALMAGARDAASDDPMSVGAGEIDITGALSAPAGVANQGIERGTGTGSLDASRGTVRFQADDPMQTVVEGTLTAQLLIWDPLSLTSEWTGGSWYGGSWYGGSWYGGSWYGGSWYGGSWYGGSWYGQMDGGSWYGGSWYGGSWYGAWE